MQIQHLLLGICAVTVHSRWQKNPKYPKNPQSHYPTLPSLSTQSPLIHGFANRQGMWPQQNKPVIQKANSPKIEYDQGHYFNPTVEPQEPALPNPGDRTNHAFSTFQLNTDLRGTSNSQASQLPSSNYEYFKEDEAEINDFDYIDTMSNEEMCGRPAYNHREDIWDIGEQQDENGRQKRSTMSDAIGDGKRIVGGQAARDHSWPWTILLTVCIDYGWAKECFKCGGVLIGKRWALTAGHCLPPNKELDIIAEVGKHLSPIDPAKPVPGRRVAVKSYMVHEAFRKVFQDGVSVIEHDLGLIEFAEEVEYSNNVRTSCLPDSKVCFKPGTTCVVVGWGYTDEQGQNGFPDRLQEAPVKIFDHNHCRKFPSYGVVNDNMLCAGWVNGGVDACGGDSGGPLTCKVGNKPEDPWVLAGTVSWGIGCARANSPGVYTNIARYSEWIERKTGIKPAIAGDGKCISTDADEADFSPERAIASALAAQGVCKEEFTVPAGKRYTYGMIKNPNYPERYGSGQTCKYCLKGDMIMIKFREFKMNLGLSRAARFENANCDEELDMIKVYDKHNKLQHKMCIWRHSRVLIRGQDEICLEWQSAGSDAAGGIFVFGYKIENNSILPPTTPPPPEGIESYEDDLDTESEDMCPHLGEMSAVTTIPNKITSPNFPNQYPDGLRCSWTVRPAIQGFDVELTLKKAVTRWTRRCREERLEAFWGYTCEEIDNMQKEGKRLPKNKKTYTMTCGRARRAVLTRFHKKVDVVCVRFRTFDPRVERSSSTNRYFNERNGQTSGWYIEVQARDS